MSSARRVEASCGGSVLGMYFSRVAVSESSRVVVWLSGRDGFSSSGVRAGRLLERRDAVGGLDDVLGLRA